MVRAMLYLSRMTNICKHNPKEDPTFNTGALLAPVDTKATHRAALTTGSVMVTRSGGGFGESLMGATVFLVSYRDSGVLNEVCDRALCVYDIPADLEHTQIIDHGNFYSETGEKLYL